MSKKSRALVDPNAAQKALSRSEYRKIDLQRRSFVTLGGCSTFEVGKRMSAGQFVSRGHLWRRPTIALVSDPIEKIDSRFGELPAEFLPYFFNDAKKQHLTNLLALDAETLIFDLTRDLRNGVVDLGENQFVLDPLEGVGIVEGLRPETNDEIFAKIFKEGERISYFRDWPRFFYLWKHAFAQMMEAISSKFGDIILLEHYFTSKVNGTPYTYDFVPEAVEKANVALQQMYAFARHFRQISFVSLPRDLYITGPDVPWGGPNDSHYLIELYFLYAEKTTRLIFPECEDGAVAIVKHLFARAAERDDLRKFTQTLSAEREQRIAENAAYCAQRDEAVSARAQAAAERDAIATRAATFESELDQTRRERDEAHAQLHAAAARIQELVAERDGLTAQAAAVCSERDRALGQRDEERAQIDAAAARAQQLAAERDQAFHAKDEALARMNEADARAQQLTAERDEFAAQARAFAAERDQAFRERDEVRAEHDAIVTHSLAIAAESSPVGAMAP